MKTLDELRDAHPDLGFALYAYDPAGAVTLEIHTPDGKTYTFVGRTESLAIALAFPPEPTAPIEPNTLSQTTNVFD